MLETSSRFGHTRPPEYPEDGIISSDTESVEEVDMSRCAVLSGGMGYGDVAVTGSRRDGFPSLNRLIILKFDHQMAESAVSFVLDRLSAWIREERQLLGSIGENAEFIRDELDVMDKFMLRFAGRRSEAFFGCIKQTYVSVKNLKARRQISSEMGAIRSRVKSVFEGQQRYKDIYGTSDQESGRTKSSWYDSRGDALLLEETEVVGIEKPKKLLIQWLSATGSCGLKVISVVGTGGLGKTTLVKKVYDDPKVKMHFSAHVWMTVSNSFKLEELLRTMIRRLVSEVKQPSPQGLEAMDADEMKEFVYKFLQHRSYIIILDDVWRVGVWEAIRYAFPRSEAFGFIVITTRFQSIGHVASIETNGHIYNLEPLSQEESKTLFCRKAFLGGPCPSYLEEIAEVVLKKCEGLPLAIVVIGSLLATKNNNIDEWKKFHGSIEVAEDYLKELLDRNLIQLVMTPDYTSPIRVRVHDLLHAIILSKSQEQSFVTIAKVGHVRWPGKSRCLAIHGSIDDRAEINGCDRYRSVLVLDSISPLSKLNMSKLLSSASRLVKVLELRGALSGKIPDEIFKLYHLKYLGLKYTKVNFVPRLIQKLENLETLNLRDTNVTEFPTLSDIEATQAEDTTIAREIGKLIQLKKLGIMKLKREDGKDVCISLAKLTNLQSLHIASNEENEIMDLQYPVSPAPPIRSLELRGRLEKVPQWIPSLHGLTKLLLRWSRINDDDPLESLQYLPNLMVLELCHAYEGDGLRFKAAGFEKLKKIWLIRLSRLRCVKTEKGSVSFLQELYMWDCKLVEEVPFGIEHLTNLECIDFTDMSEGFVTTLEKQKEEGGDQWKLANIPKIEIYSLSDGKWQGRRL
ncbi:hypothetical protein BUALT_Bualt03G0114800 [Buddleja alternifolia]|uniref:Uncharacterized protein n=1 Tax=Buddleja alternifolia TaxID=168488 RepID=A0AAV6XU26_9LAMI|nr:hypothetical protein BUALT_Bualt03G0114800 [Buddleja alternifolia]